MTINSDSTRFYINGGSGAKGNFGVDGLEGDSKDGTGNGGFAVSGRGGTKGNGNGNLFNIDLATDAQTLNGVNRIYWYPESNAFMAGNLLVERPDDVGENSFNAGYQNKAKGKWSQAFGFRSIATGETSIAIGYQAIARGKSSFSFGRNTDAEGENSVAIGSGAVTEQVAKNSVAFGNSAFARNEGSFAFGKEAYSSGKHSFAFGGGGDGTINVFFESIPGPSASGDYSYAFGPGAQATQKGAIAIGFKAEATGEFSTAIGNAKAKGYYSMAVGIGTIANAGEFAIGSYNTDYNPSPGPDTKYRQFVIGSGSGDDHRADALVVYTNGDTEINGDLKAEVTTLDRLIVKDDGGENYGNGYGVGSSLIPCTVFSESYDLGRDHARWGNVYAYNINANGTVTISGNLTVSGKVASALKPNATGLNLGDSDNRWGSIYANTINTTGQATVGILSTTGAATVGSLSTTGTISGGAISGTSLSTSGNLTVSGKVASTLLPNTSTLNLGNSNNRWNGVYSTSLNTNTISASTNTIAGEFSSTGKDYGTSGFYFGGTKYTNTIANAIYADASSAGTSSAGATNFGIFAYASGNGASSSYKNNNYAIYAKASGSNANNYAGYFDGAVTITGATTLSGAITVGGSITPTSSYNLGGTDNRWYCVYSSTINTSGKATVGSLSTSGTASVGSLSTSGTISGGAISGTSLLTTGTASVGSLSASGEISGGAISGSSLSTTGNLSVSGKVTTSLKPNSSLNLGGTGTNERWNYVYTSYINASNSATVGSLSTSGTISGGAISGTSLSTSGNLSVSGKVASTLKPSAASYNLGGTGTNERWKYVYAQIGNYSTSAETTSLTVTNTSSSNYTNGISASASYGYRVSTGVSGIANSATGTNIGVYGEADEQRSDGTHYGVKGYANGASENYAIYGEVEESNYYTNYAVWAEGPAGGTTSWWNSSDARLKKDVQTLNGALDKVLKLRGVTYYWKSNEERGDSIYLHLDNKKHIGVIAQELEQEFPELVNTGRGGYKTVEYATLAPVLIEAIKELKAEKDELKAEKDALEAKVEKLEAQMQEILEKLGK
ncbi:MAG: tail fiber domain-containing protein, partial [Salinivirgaceae bacterium]|nr:tail fiber domain-containing protein [Salinivirgaceae bacterium]